jgi:hypothetical protein
MDAPPSMAGLGRRRRMVASIGYRCTFSKAGTRVRRRKAGPAAARRHASKASPGRSLGSRDRCAPRTAEGDQVGSRHLHQEVARARRGGEMVAHRDLGAPVHARAGEPRAQRRACPAPRTPSSAATAHCGAPPAPPRRVSAPATPAPPPRVPAPRSRRAYGTMPSLCLGVGRRAKGRSPRSAAPRPRGRSA